MSDPAASVAAEAVRTSYRRLLGRLAAGTDRWTAEDALAAAIAAALQAWPARGVPDDPDAWLYVVASRRVTDVARRRQVRAEPPLAELGRAACDPAFAVAIGLTEQAALRDHLVRRRAACGTRATTGTA